MAMPSRTWNREGYRYGFGGHERENEVNSGWYSFGDYGYDARLGRRPKLDPIDQISVSNYAAFRDNPLYFIDPDGRFNLPNYSDEELSTIGLTRDDMDRFTTLVTNIGNIVKNNSDALNAISNTTGLSQEQILNDMKFGEGPTININGGNGDAYARNSEITIDVQVVKDLASIDFKTVNRNSGSKELAHQAFATSMLILHEYGHYGDQKTNGGYNTGQFDENTGESDEDFNYGASRTSKSKKDGIQEWSQSKTGHRGTDVTKIGFKADVYVREGNHLFLEASNASKYLKNDEILKSLKINK
jgi:hypothetical protein